MTVTQLLGIKAGANDSISDLAIQGMTVHQVKEDELVRVRKECVLMVSLN